MKSENLSSNNSSMFGISGMWMKTLWRRDIIVCFVAFIAYFCVTILPMIFNFSSFNLISGYYEEMLLTSELSPAAFITLIYAISLSVMLFDYLHNTASTAALHSFPVTRGKLFRTTVAVGTALLLIPILLIALAMFAAGQLMPPVANSTGMVVPSDILSFTKCAGWFIDTAVGALFIFAVSNLAGVIAGKNIIHALLAYLLNGIVAIVLLLIDTYESSFIFGSAGTSLTSLAQKTDPFLWYATERGGALSLEDAPMMLAFVGVTVLVTILTGVLYKKIKLERETSATVFPIVSDMLVIFCSFCVMSMIGMITATLQAPEATMLPVVPFLLGSLVGGIGAFIVFRMIADSSVRIFHPRSLVNYIAFAAISCLIFAFTCLDITGQAAKIPDASKVAKVEMETLEPFSATIKLDDSDSISNLTELHKAVLSHRDEKKAFSNSDSSMTVSMSYTLKNGGKMKRRYNIEASGMKDVLAAADKLASSDEYITKVENYLHKAGLHAAKGSYIYTSKADIELKEDDIRPLIMAFMDDYKANGFRYYYDMSMAMSSVIGTEKDYTNQKTGTISISLDPSFAEESEPYDNEMHFYFGKKDKNVLAFLKENGYEKKILRQEKKFSPEKDA